MLIVKFHQYSLVDSRCQKLDIFVSLKIGNRTIVQMPRQMYTFVRKFKTIFSYLRHKNHFISKTSPNSNSLILEIACLGRSTSIDRLILFEQYEKQWFSLLKSNVLVILLLPNLTFISLPKNHETLANKGFTSVLAVFNL